MSRTYEIRPRPATLGTGWELKLIENGQEAGGSIFLVVEEERRAHWLMMAASAIPADARHAYLLAQAYNDAFDEGEAWIGCKS